MRVEGNSDGFVQRSFCVSVMPSRTGAINYSHTCGGIERNGKGVRVAIQFQCGRKQNINYCYHIYKNKTELICFVSLIFSEKKCWTKLLLYSCQSLLQKCATPMSAHYSQQYVNVSIKCVSHGKSRNVLVLLIENLFGHCQSPTSGHLKHTKTFTQFITIYKVA